jgi:pyruvate/2-oxoglutarate dehydrogenase complex dihydrolipoamide dehydrogenase (E3) component
VEAFDPEAVVVATGSAAGSRGRLAGAPPIESPRAVSARDALRDASGVGARTVVVDFGGQAEGLSVAEYLLDLGREVELITQHLVAGAKIGGNMQVKLLKDVKRKGAVVTPHSLVVKVDDDIVGVLDVFSGQTTHRRGVDSIVVAGDAVADDALLQELRATHTATVYPVGDCVAPRQIDMAILDGGNAGRAIA